MALDLIVGRMPKGAQPSEVLALGPWCFADQEEDFPEWETNFSFAPEPFVDYAQAENAVLETKALCASLFPAFLAQYSEDNTLPRCYYETLLLPWFTQVAEQIVERWHRVRALMAAYATVPLTLHLSPTTATMVFLTDADYTVRGALGSSYNTELFSWLFTKANLPPSWHITYDAILGPEDRGTSSPHTGLRARCKELVARLLRKLPFPHIKGVRLTQSLCFSLALCHKSPGDDRSQSLDDCAGDPATQERLLQQLALPESPLPLFVRALPRSLATLTHPASIQKTNAPTARVASIVAYEDASYRQSLAIFRAQGHRLIYVQHGGNYGQIRFPCRTHVTELCQHAFITWGWKDYEGVPGNYIPLPSPQLARIKNAWQQKKGTLLFVGTEMPLYGYRLDARPTPLQTVDYRAAKARFFSKLPANIRAQAVYRPYFTVPSTLRDWEWISQKLPELTRSTGPLTPQILGTKLLVLDHHGTTLLEAMAANVPLVLYWNREHWPVTDAFLDMLDRLERAAIFFATPEEAATHIAGIWSDVTTWWHDTVRQAARTDFCEHYARILPTNETSLWRQTLKTL